MWAEISCYAYGKIYSERIRYVINIYKYNIGDRGTSIIEANETLPQ